MVANYLTKGITPFSYSLLLFLSKIFCLAQLQGSTQPKAGGAMSILEHLLYFDILHVLTLILGLASLVI